MELTPRVLAEHIAKRRREPLACWTGNVMGRRGRFPSQGTITIEISRAKTMMRWASNPDQGLIPSNPIASVRVQKHRHRETALTEADVAKVIEVATPTLRAFVLICIDSGLRLNEARHLRRDWIRPGGVVAIPWTITKSKRTRLVVLTPRAIEAIGAMPEETLQHPEVFRNPNTGRLYGEGTFWRAFREACEAAGIDRRAAAGDDRIHIHDLRHTAASAAIRRGAPITAVQQMLGHANLSTTSIYLHADESDAINLARLMQEGADRERTAAVAR
jgi:integrase/recombinase XerD